MMKQAQKMQARMQEAQAEIGQMQVQGESGAGLVKVTMNGRHEVSRVEIDPAVLGEEKSVLEDLLAAACNDTVRRVEKAQAEKMKELGVRRRRTPWTKTEKMKTIWRATGAPTGQNADRWRAASSDE